MRLEKFALQNFNAPPASVVEGVSSKGFMPPSFGGQPERKASAPPPPPAAPAITREDVKNAEQEGYRKGFLEGVNEGRMQAESEQAEVTRRLEEAVETLSSQLRGLIDAYNDFVSEQHAEMPKLALAVARKVAGAALENNALAALESVIAPAIERMLGQPRMIVTVNESLVAALEQRLAARFAHNNDPGEIAIEGDAELAPGDCRINWENGSAERSTEALWKQVEAMVAEMVAGTSPPLVSPPAAEAAPASSEIPPTTSNISPEGA